MRPLLPPRTLLVAVSIVAAARVGQRQEVLGDITLFLCA
jgi:hypothetical protein